MAKFQVVFERNGRQTRMAVEAPNKGNAHEVGTYFQVTYGKLLKVEAAK